MRRPYGQAAELILKTVADAHPEGVTYSQLRERTGLAGGTVQDNVKALSKQGKVQTFKEDNRTVWVCLPE